MATELVRDAPLGHFIRFVSRGRLLKYPEEEPGFRLPPAWLEALDASPVAISSSPRSRSASGDSVNNGNNEETNKKTREETEPGEKHGDKLDSHNDTLRPDAPPYAAVRRPDDATALALSSTRSREQTAPFSAARLEADEAHELEKTRSLGIAPRRTSDGTVLVDWYTTDDPANPQNWSRARRFGVTAIICAYTFVVYTTSAIYTTSYEGIMRDFGVSVLQASLGLSLYVLGYGVGPLLFSPLSEIPAVGRNPVYVVTMFLFVVVSVPAALVDNYPGLMVLRFLQGFFGSPCLASGGASLADMYGMLSFPYAIMAWTAAAYCGPALGPLLSGFSVPVMGWRWSLLEPLWASVPVFLLMFVLLPETSPASILLRRARRLRRVTGDARFVSQSELDHRGTSTRAVVLDALVKPLEITIKDPAIMFVQVYTAIIYGIYYSFFEVFPLVYPVYYRMSPGQVGLVFLCVLVACLLGIAAYAAVLYLHTIPGIRARGFPVNEKWLVPALPASLGPTAGLFLFAWTANAAVHWIVPTIGITIYGATVFVVMQCIFVYVPTSYPRYAASLFAANDFFRSALACGSVLFAQPLYHNLGVARGTSLLGGLSVIGIVGIWLLYVYGARLRSMSKFAVYEE